MQDTFPNNLDESNVSDDRKTVVRTPSPLSDDRLTTVIARPVADDRETTVMKSVAPAPAPSWRDGGVVVPVQPLAPPPGPGTYQINSYVLHGKYQIEERLKGGAQAMAFRGRRVVDGAQVFIKVQPNPTGRADAFAKQIAIRHKILAINHPNLLRCFDFDLDGTALCEVYEWLGGRELSEFLRDTANPFNEQTNHEMLEQLSTAINELHESTELTHRDLKPDNIRVVDRNGRLAFVIVDYGLVSRLDSGGATTMAGTRMYSPPEFYMRRISNDSLLRSWDWWSLGRILQESLDGVHAYDRLPALYRAELNSGSAHSQEALEMIFDAIMTESDYTKYRMRAGMVELSERNSRHARWIPLLRGLLTSNRRTRWGFAQVKLFISGKPPQDFYGMAADVDGFDFEGQPWGLPELAAKLASESAAIGDPGLGRWREAQDLVHRGSLLRYIDKTLCDADLSRKVKACQDVEDRDLSTALALSIISGGTFPPAIRCVEINVNYLLSQADRTDSGKETHLATLLSQDFQRLLASVAPGTAEALNEEAQRVRDLREHFRKVGGRGELDLSDMLLLVHASKNALIDAINEKFRPKLNRSSNEKLETMYATRDLSSLSPFDLRALYWGLSKPGHNGFISHERRAEELQTTAKTMRAALALKQAAKFYTWRYWPFNGSFRRLFGITAVIAMFLMFRSGVGYIQQFPQGYSFSFEWFTILSSGFCFGLLYGLLKIALNRSIRKVVGEFLNLAPKGQSSSPQLLGFAKEFGGDAKYSQCLNELNQQIAALPNVNTAHYLVPRASFRWVHGFLGAQIAMLVILLFSARLYGPMFVERTPLPSQLSQPQQPVQKGKTLKRVK